MSLWDWIGLAICAGLAIYLFAALLRPELFD
jgi:K+-transporting ATPase KdpF subunit